MSFGTIHVVVAYVATSNTWLYSMKLSTRNGLTEHSHMCKSLRQVCKTAGYLTNRAHIRILQHTHTHS